MQIAQELVHGFALVVHAGIAGTLAQKPPSSCTNDSDLHVGLLERRDENSLIDRLIVL
jgi:hypothetical protein